MGNRVTVINREGLLWKTKLWIYINMLLAADYHVAPIRPWEDSLQWVHKVLDLRLLNSAKRIVPLNSSLVGSAVTTRGSSGVGTTVPLQIACPKPPRYPRLPPRKDSAWLRLLRLLRLLCRRGICCTASN